MTGLIKSLLVIGTSLAATSAWAKAERIAYVSGLTTSPFYISVSCGAAAEAKNDGITFDTQGPTQWSSAEQLRILEAILASRPAGLLISHNDPVALTPTLMRAKEMGIKVISIDGDLDDHSVALSNIQSDNELAGAAAAKRTAQLIGEKGEVLAVVNSPAALVAQLRLKGFTDELANHKGIVFLGAQYSNNQTPKAASIVSSTIASHPNLAAVFGVTTNNTEGAVIAVREAQRVGQIKIVGFDTSDPIIDAIRDGVISAEVIQHPYRIGETGVRLMVDALAGKDVPREVRTPFVVADKQNIDSADVKEFIYKTRCK
jgi:ribose transport system substrate-binding protein